MEGSTFEGTAQSIASHQQQSADMPNADQDDQLEPVDDASMGKGNKRSLKFVVWNHFKRQKVDDKWKAICNYCHKKLGGDTKNGTRHLHEHFTSCPLRKTGDNSEGKTPLASFKFDEEVSRKELALAIILHGYPLSMVENPQFRSFLASIQPLFKPISQSTLESDIMKIYESERIKTIELLRTTESKIAFTSHMWTSNNKEKGFMAITAHFIDASWQMQSRIIRFACVPCPHTADVLCGVLFDCLDEMRNDHKLSALTLDNCSTNDAMVNLIANKLIENNLWLDGNLTHVRCSAQTLNLIVKYGIEVIDETVEKIRNVVAYWTATPKRYEMFEEIAKVMHISHDKKLALDCKTKWDSTYLMLNVAIHFKNVFKRLKQRESMFYCIKLNEDWNREEWKLPPDEEWKLPSDEEWENVAQICEKLKIFYDIMERFAGTKYPTVNDLFPYICEIKFQLMKGIDCQQPCIKSMASKMVEKFNKYWVDVSCIMSVATVLDPRYKLHFLEFFFPMFYEDEIAKLEVEKVRRICYELFDKYQSNLKIVGKSELSHSQSSSQSGKSSSWIFDNFRKMYEEKNADKYFRNELDLYLEERVEDCSEDFDILRWWKEAHKYPTLRILARDILAIPVSTAFSTSVRFIGPHRSSLHPNIVEALMCAKNWLMNPLKDSSGPKSSSTTHTSIDDDDDDDEDEDDDWPNCNWH